MTDTAALPVRIEISHPVTHKPTWLLEWNGETVAESLLPDGDPDAGYINDWGGYAFHGEWETMFATWQPEEVAAEIMDLQLGAGFNARLLPDDRTE